MRATGTRKATSATTRKAKRTTAAKLAASVLLVAGAASVAGLGTFGSFTSSTSASEQVASGTIKLGLNQGVQGTTLAATGLVPGDTVQRDVTLTRGATDEKFGSLRLTSTASAANALSTDTTNGLRIAVDQCSVAWTKGATAGATDKTPLTCGGTVTPVLTDRALVQSNVDLPNALAALNTDASRTSNLRVTLTLPSAAGNEFQGLSNTANLVFDVTQRAAESR